MDSGTLFYRKTPQNRSVSITLSRAAKRGASTSKNYILGFLSVFADAGKQVV